MLHGRVGLSLDNLRDLETRLAEESGHLFGTEKVEFDRDVLSPPLVEVDDVIADVERQEQ